MESAQSADSEIPGLPRAASNLSSLSLDETASGDARTFLSLGAALQLSEALDMEPACGLGPPSGLWSPERPGPAREGAAAAAAARPGPARAGAAAALAAHSEGGGRLGAMPKRQCRLRLETQPEQSLDYSGENTVAAVFDDLQECSRCSRCDCDKCKALAINAWGSTAL